MGFDLIELIRTVGYAGILGIVFSETGLFLGFFLPGDSLLLTAGLLAARGELNIYVLLAAIPLAAFLGDQTGYWFGRKTGPPLFTREASLLFRRKNLLAARAFYDKYGGIAILAGRFMPFIRTFVPMVAGAVEMPYRRFLTFEVASVLVWSFGVTLAGFFLGRSIEPDVLDRYFLLIIIVVIFVSALPAMIHAWREYRHEVWDFLRMRIRALRSRNSSSQD